MKQLRCIGLIWAIVLLCSGCRSTKPPPPTPRAVTAADRLSSQAETLSEQQNWSGAANAWKKSAEQYALLNDLPRQAVALHNQGQAELEQGHAAAASELFEKAAELNQKLRRDAEWWRNQIGWLQAEAVRTNHTPELEARFAELEPKAKELQQPLTAALFVNELGLWQRKQKKFEDSEASLRQAQQKFEQAQHPSGVAVALSNRALLAEETKSFSAAETLWRDALKRFEDLADPPAIARALAGIGRSMCQQEKNLPEAEDLLRRAASNFDLLKKDTEKRKVLVALADCLKKQGKEQEAGKILKDL